MAPRTLTVRPPSSPNRRSAGLFAKAVKNNTPSSFNDRTLRDYLKNFSRQRGTDGQGDTFSTEVDTLSLGSTLQILPRVLSGERLGLLLTMSQASLVELQTLPLGDDGSFIQLDRPEERRGGQEVVSPYRTGWWPSPEQKTKNN